MPTPGVLHVTDCISLLANVFGRPWLSYLLLLFEYIGESKLDLAMVMAESVL